MRGTALLFLGALVAILICSPAQAATVVIDFNDPSGLKSSPTRFEEDGFTVSLVQDHLDYWNPSIGGGGSDDTPYVGTDALNTSTGIIELTGGVFDLASLDAIWVVGGDPNYLQSSAGGNLLFESNGTHYFSGPEWSNLTWLRLVINEPIGGPGWDNITVNTVVPVPAAVWLFGSALGFLGWMRRNAA